MLKSKSENIVISKIIENYRSGLWSIPESLSDYAWENQKNKAAMFIASLYLGCPVSSILIWESQEVIVRDPYVSPERVAWMLDGQQQIMTLCKVIDKESGLKIVFNPRITDAKKGAEGQFRAESAITKKTTDWIDVSRILGNREEFCSVLDDDQNKEYRIRLIRLREILNSEMTVHKLSGFDYKSIVHACETYMMARKNLRER
jgi:hypothetical protein